MLDQVLHDETLAGHNMGRRAVTGQGFSNDRTDRGQLRAPNAFPKLPLDSTLRCHLEQTVDLRGTGEQQDVDGPAGESVDQFNNPFAVRRWRVDIRQRR